MSKGQTKSLTMFSTQTRYSPSTNLLEVEESERINNCSMNSLVSF